MSLEHIAHKLSHAVSSLAFALPVTHVYNPLEYAWEPHRRYLERYGAAPKEVLLVGMNPGPFGMAQTGVPFGDVACVRDWLGVSGAVGRPSREHPKRPVHGFDCARSEVSGTRLWSWARDRFGSPERFFARFFVYNYCPLAFIEGSGRNRTPDKLPPTERMALYRVCDEALDAVMNFLTPRYAVGIGAFAEARIRAVPQSPGRAVCRIPHPSPASPAANAGWAAAAEKALAEAGIRL